MCVVMTTRECFSALISPAKSMRSWCLILMITFTLHIFAVNGSEAISTSLTISSSSSNNLQVNNSLQSDANITSSNPDETQWNATISIDFSHESYAGIPLVSNLSVSNISNNDNESWNVSTTNQLQDKSEEKNISYQQQQQQQSENSTFQQFDQTVSYNDNRMINNNNTNNTKMLLSASRELYVRLLEFAFIFLTFLIVVCAFRTSIRRQSMRCYSLIIDFFLLSLAVSRALTLFLEPTSGLPSDTTSTLLLTLFNLPFPSLLASFTLVLFSILHLTNVHPFNSTVQTNYILFILIILQFFSVLFLDIFLYYFSAGNQIPIGELTFSLWFWLFSVIFFYYFRQLRFVSLRKQSEIMRFTFTKLHIEGGRLPPKLPYSPLKIVIYLIFTTVALTLCLTFLLVFNVIMKLGFYNDKQSLNLRFILYSSSRILEILVSFLLLYITMQPLDVATNKSMLNAFSHCTCSDTCGDKSSIGDDIYPTYCANNSAVARTHFTFEHWNSANNCCNQQALINSASLGVQKVTETINRSFAQSNNRRQISLTTLATLSDVHSHPSTNNFIRNHNSNMELDIVGPTTPSCRSPARNLFNSILLRRCGSSDSSGFDVHLQRRSSMTKTEELSRRRSGGSTPAKDCRKIPNLNLSSVSTNKPHQDITPDSAVDLEFPSDSIGYSQLPLSHSMNDLQVGCYGFTTSSKHKGLSHSFLNRLRSSTFSLSSHQGYEQFDSPQRNYRKNWEMKTAFRGSGASSRVSRDVHSDCIYSSDDQSSHFSSQCGRFNSVVCVSTEVQTEPFDFVHQVVVHSN